MTPSLRWGPLALVVCLAACQRSPAPPIAESPDMMRLHKIAEVYFDALQKTGKPPADEKAARALLKAHGDPDDLLRSPDDGKPYVVLWGVDLRKIAGKSGSPPIVAYQRDGKNGKRLVMTTMGLQTLRDEEFQTAEFVAAKHP